MDYFELKEKVSG